jgi:hypothetical protein
MKAAWISKWTRPVPGREARALEVFMESMDFWGKRQADGQVEGYETFLSPAGPGMVVIKGERAKLAAILDTDEYLKLLTKINLNVDGVQGEMMLTGDAVNHLIGMWAETGKEQGYL